jgi:hypothetical protein
VHHHARRLVDDQEMLVLVRETKIELLGLEVRPAPLRDLDLEALPAREPVALRTRSPVDEDAARPPRAARRA